MRKLGADVRSDERARRSIRYARSTVGEVSEMAVRLEKQDAIGHIVLDRPPANSYDRAFMEELDAAIEEARKDDEVRAIVVRSASEKFFSAGADVSVFAKSDFDTQNAF